MRFNKLLITITALWVICTFSPCWADRVQFSDGRLCDNCTVTMQGGYVVKIIHPQEGSWRLVPNTILVVTRSSNYQVDVLTVDPNYTYTSLKGRKK